MSDTENGGSEQLDPIAESCLIDLVGNPNRQVSDIASRVDYAEDVTLAALKRLKDHGVAESDPYERIWLPTDAGRLLSRYLDTESDR